MRVAACDTRRARLAIGDGMAEQVGYIVRMGVRCAESRCERMSKVVKVEVRKARRLDGCLKAGHQLPEVEGREFLREITTSYPHNYRVMLTSDVMVGDMIAEISTGIINLFIAKPWSEQEMRQMLERVSVAQKLWGKYT
jgi:FixJ family two-component response regulator